MDDKLQRIFKNCFGIESLSDNLSIDDIPEWDSMRHIGLILEIEKEFSVSLSIDDSIEMISLKAIKEILNEHEIY